MPRRPHRRSPSSSPECSIVDPCQNPPVTVQIGAGAEIAANPSSPPSHQDPPATSSLFVAVNRPEIHDTVPSNSESEDDLDLLNRTQSGGDSRARTPSRNSSEIPSQSDVTEALTSEEMNASGRTPIPTEKREEGGNAGSDSTREERREANSQNSTQDEIIRLRAELAASNARFSQLMQNSDTTSRKSSTEFTAEISTEIPASTRTLSSGEEIQETSSAQVSNLSQSKDDQMVFTIDDDDEEGDARKNTQVPSQSERALHIAPVDTTRENAPVVETRAQPQKNATGQPGKQAVKPAPAATKGVAAARTKPAKKHDRTSRSPSPPYNGEAAVFKSGQKVIYSDNDPRSKQGEKVAGANKPLDVCRPFEAANVRGPSTHDGNVAELLKYWPHPDAVHALAQTMTEEGEEDVTRAFEFLVAQRDNRIAAAVRREKEQAPGKGSREEEDEEETIREDGELAVFLAGAPGSIMVVLHLLKVHKRMRNVHNAALERTAANLIANPQIQNFHDLKHVSSEQLRLIAVAVVHDCRECEAARIREAARLLEEKQKAKENTERIAREEKAKEAEAERGRRALVEKKRKESEEAERRRQTRTPPLDDIGDDGNHSSHQDFDENDSKWVRKRKAQTCYECKKGDLGGTRQHLYVCDVCDRCFHKTCIRWAKIVRWDEDPRSELSNFACPGCKKSLPSKWKLHDSEQVSTPIVGEGGRADRASATPLIRTPGFTDRTATAPAAGGGDANLCIVGSTLDATGTANTGTNSGVSFKIDKYFEWKAPPSDWDILKTHPECGMTKPAYQNWKALNISRRDQAGGALGPLTNAIREDMMASVASVLIMNHPTIRAGRNEIEFAAWLESDPQYKWVKTIPDTELLRCIDKHFCILDHEPFVAMKFGGPAQGYHPTTEDGDTNYFASAFSAFADRWLNALKELKTGGWDDKTRDLRQTFVNALEAQPTLHREASTYRTTNHEILIAYMRGWCIQRETEVQKNAHTRAQTAAARTAAVKSPTHDRSASDKYEKQIKVLRTEIGALKAQVGTGDRAVIARIPSHIDSKTQWYCHGCGKTYSKDGRAIPCETQCVYYEHAEHNKEYKKGKAWPADKAPLSWGTAESYKAKYKIDLPPTGKKYIELRAKYARKRERPSDATPA
jgi:hypothetical protein